MQSLLTGNIVSNARVKLGTFGLDRFVDFEIGAYGPTIDAEANWSRSPATARSGASASPSRARTRC